MQNLALRGGAEGMKIELYDASLLYLGRAEVSETGALAVIDLDGKIHMLDNYYIKVIANPSEYRVQIYEVFLRNDLRLAWPYLKVYKYEKFIPQPPELHPIPGKIEIRK